MNRLQRKENSIKATEVAENAKIKMHGQDARATLANFIATALLLTIIQIPFKSSFLAWVAYVPLIIAATRAENKKALYFFSWLVAFFYWLGNIYWMGYVTVAGWLVFCAYTALLWPVLIMAMRYLNSKKIPLMISCAVLVVGIEKLQGLFLGGFYWRHLSHSQYQFITLIQIADIFGAAGVSFLIAMVNGFIAELFIAKQDSAKKRLICLKAIIVIAAVGGALFYGNWRINQGKKTIKPGPVVGAVQSNLPQTVKTTDSFEESKKNFQDILALSRKCAAAGALLDAWPETIVPSIMDKETWPFLLNINEILYYHKQLCQHAKEGIYLLAGAPGGYIEYKENDELLFDKFNSAFLYTPYGEQAAENYDKIHLVPFGECVPFKKSFPLLHKLLMSFSPYDFDYTLTPGDDYTIFKIHNEKPNKEYSFGVMICYESAIPQIARRFTLDDDDNKRIDWLINISNDGWFVRYDNGQATASTELSQHAIASVFRAVENRISIVRSVNTGISCLIDTSGNIRNSYIEGNLPENAFERQGVAGYFVDSVPIDCRVTFFSKFGQWLDNGCAIIVFLVLILLITGHFGRNISKRKIVYGKKNNQK